MLSLCLAILSSSMVSVVMRLSGSRVKQDMGMLAMNYLVCTLLSGAFNGFRGLVDPSNARLAITTVLGAVNGVLYLAGFLLMQLNIRRNGVVLSSIFQKLGLLVTLVVSVCVYREYPDLTQSLGFVIALGAIVLMNYQKGGSSAGFKAGLIWMLLACGTADAMAKVFTEAGLGDLEGQFLLVTFATAGVFCLLFMAVKGQRIGKWEAVFGSLIAVPNFFASKFLLGALESLAAVIVYPVYSVGSILLVTLVGVLAFRERLRKGQWLGIGLILIALVLLNV